MNYVLDTSLFYVIYFVFAGVLFWLSMERDLPRRPTPQHTRRDAIKESIIHLLNSGLVGATIDITSPKVGKIAVLRKYIDVNKKIGIKLIVKQTEEMLQTISLIREFCRNNDIAISDGESKDIQNDSDITIDLADNVNMAQKIIVECLEQEFYGESDGHLIFSSSGILPWGTVDSDIRGRIAHTPKILFVLLAEFRNLGKLGPIEMATYLFIKSAGTLGHIGIIYSVGLRGISAVFGGKADVHIWIRFSENVYASGTKFEAVCMAAVLADLILSYSPFGKRLAHRDYEQRQIARAPAKPSKSFVRVLMGDPRWRVVGLVIMLSLWIEIS